MRAKYDEMPGCCRLLQCFFFGKLPAARPISVHPAGGHPLRFALQRIDLGQQLMVGALRVIVDDDVVEQMAPACLHVACGRDDFFEVVVLSDRSERNV